MLIGMTSPAGNDFVRKSSGYVTPLYTEFIGAWCVNFTRGSLVSLVSILGVRYMRCPFAYGVMTIITYIFYVFIAVSKIEWRVNYKSNSDTFIHQSAIDIDIDV